MIALTDSSPVSSVIGGQGKTGYDRLTINSCTFSANIPPDVLGAIVVTASNVPDAPPLLGTVRINPGGATTLAIAVPGLQAYPPVINLSSEQNDQLAKISAEARAALEQILIDVGVVSGTQEK